MVLVVNRAEIETMLLRQLRSFFTCTEEEIGAIRRAFDMALERCEVCFSRVRNKYYSRDGVACFDALHGCQWAAFLYFLSNSIYRLEGANPVCDKIYALGKVMSGADLFYQVELPEVFTFDHPLGGVIGRGCFSDYFSFSQGCTVGNNHGIFPRFGHSVFMLSDSKVLGDCSIGSNVIIAANAYVKDADVPDGSLVFGQSPNLIIKEGRLDQVRDHAEKVFLYE